MSGLSALPIPIYGFGDKTSADAHVFPFHSAGKPCKDFSDVLATYASRIPSVALAGPTSFGPIVTRAVEHALENKMLTILIILADGQVTSVRDTEMSIVEASKSPLSIVCVGIGDGPWDEMRRFDDGLPTRKFDNFQFLELGQIQQSAAAEGKTLDEAFFCAAFEELPAQIESCKKLGIL
jgi:E3 ubiquitin-protein ligase RGLG